MGWLEDLGKAASDAAKTVVKAVGKAVEEATETITETADKAVDWVADTATKGINAGVDFIEKTLGKGAGQVARAFGNWLKSGIEIGRAGGHIIVAGGRLIGKGAACVVQGDLTCVQEAFADFGDTFRKQVTRVLFGYHICDSSIGRSVPSQKRLVASAFSIGLTTAESRFAYIDSGKFYQFEIRNDVVWHRRGDVLTSEWQPLSESVSYTKYRRGDFGKAPVFDMIAASGGRVFVKEEGLDNFYFIIVDPMFLQFRSKLSDPSDDNVSVPSTYIKLDPEHNLSGEQTQDLVEHVRGNYHHHPASERFQAYRMVLSSTLTDFMFVAVREKVWHLLDTRPKVDGGDLPDTLSHIPTYNHIKYCHNLPIYPTRIETSIDFSKVLDIGVGHVHWHEHYSPIYGGEMQPLMATLEILNLNDLQNVVTIIQNKFPKFDIRWFHHLYRFFNGPVEDGDGFIDGTCNYYLLVELRSKPNAKLRQRYAILWLDEQAYMSHRWRLLNPKDCEPIEIEKFNFLLVAELARSPQTYGFNIANYWCPFENGNVTNHSRMAVARQVILINGYDPQLKQHELYSMNFSWGTCDHTWRWRSFKHENGKVITARLLSDNDVLNGGEHITVADDVPNSLFPQTLRLREDMTIHIKGTKNIGTKIMIGRWVQKYLPSNNEPVPSKHKLNGSKPSEGYGHHWQFLPEATFVQMERFSHFGIFEKVNARRQYYLVELQSDLSVLEGLPEDTRWSDEEGILRINALAMNWNFDEVFAGASAGAIVGGAIGMSVGAVTSLIQTTSASKPSLFNPGQTFLKLVKREPLGWILMWWDKRDDDLSCFTNEFPVIVSLSDGQHTIQVRILEHHSDNSTYTLKPPVVQHASVEWNANELGEVLSARVSFSSTEPEGHLAENIWRVKIGALDMECDNGICIFFDLPREGNFYRRHNSGAQVWYDYEWKPDTPQAEQLQKYCTELGRFEFGTSIWFVNVVGQVSLPELALLNV